MCASYHLTTDAQSLQTHIKVNLPEQFEFSKYVRPYQSAPVILNHEGQNILKLMNFSLIPSWSKEPKVKFATHNARIESINEKPTWKNPFKKNHCLIPISGFVEPIYTGEYAGNMVQFTRKENDLLFAAGIYDTWVNKETGEVIDSFAIVMTDPSDYIAKIGHDRSPIFLPSEKFDHWLDSKEMSPDEMRSYLLASSNHYELKVDVERPMAKGWEKRK